jgi:very-short-patch-repair endonuclease
MPSAQTLLHRLLDYIAEQAKDIDPRAYRLSAVSGFIRQRADAVGLPGVEFDLKVAGDHVWLRILRLEANRPPAPPEAEKDCLKISLDPNGAAPSIEEARLLYRVQQACQGLPPEEHAALSSQIREGASRALASYSAQWNVWAEAEKPRRKTIALYGDFFALKHQLEAEETAKPHEFVWGIGIAAWQLKFEGTSVTFEYPLLTQAIEISLDEKTMALELRPRATDTRVELDAFIACQIPGAADVEKTARTHLISNKDRPVTPFDPASYSDVLKLAATNLDSEGSYQEILAASAPLPLAGEHLVVTDGWVLLARPRSNNYLFEDLKRLQGKLESGCEIPAGPGALVTPPSDKPVEYEPVRFRGLSSRGDSGGNAAEELYFALPYNDEQVTIVQRLERAPGVAVQGPPGTGKTHTIANIICHYLATGRRVLVTSRGEPALKVLQEKIPEEVRPLTVALLASDREGVRQFQTSIEAIQHRVSQLNPELTKRELETLEGSIDRAHAELARIDKRVDEIAIAQLSEVEVDGNPLRAQKLAELVVSGREQYGWFDDAVTLAKEHAPPFAESEAAKLRDARRKLGSDLVYAQARIPSADDLPAVAAIAELHEILTRIKKIEAEVAHGKLLSLKATTSEIMTAANELLRQIEEAIGLVEELENFEDGWAVELRTKCRQPSFSSERQALESLFSDLDVLVEARAQFLKRPVEFPEEGLSAVKTREAVARAAVNGKPFGLISIGAGDAKQHVAAVRIAGLVPANIEDWAHVQRFIELHEKVLSFVVRWNGLAENLALPRLDGGVTSLRRVEMVATTARKAHKLASHYDAHLPKRAEAVFDHVPTKELLGTRADLSTIRDHLLRHLTRAELSRAATQLSIIQEKLAGKTGPVSEAVREFIQKDLGDSALPQEKAAARYAELVAELRRIAGLSAELCVIRELAERLETAGAPKLATRLRSEPVQSSGEDKAFPANWRQAWNWARMRQYLDSIEAREELVALSRRRQDLEGGLARFYKEMVAKAAWLATKRNATPKVLQALAGYATAIRRIGQGTGPNATRYRRDAREAMLDAAGAVPCWIMNHARISEAMPANIGAFDLVIVDEASQSDLWALPAILRGKKILVVGDDKQVSPDAGFIASQRIQELKGRFLAEQPYGTEMTPEKSLYDLAARVFAAEQVMLREHFRCVPPIIAYSNRVFYKGGIQPLRIPKPSERLDPPLIDIHIPDGVRDRHDRNELEALAIAEEIGQILKDKRFAGRSLGVVSLLGMDQAKYIDSVVRERCDAAELLRRRFECGDARTFQGSERSIMFLSMVVDPANCKAISGNMFDQRFNVAASRAEDRMYLVRSVSASDLSDKDLRLTLLSHFDKPLVTDKEEAERLIDRCESGFERQVYSALVGKGYRVVPQVKTGAYRLDMVVEGGSDVRLAIECDGDDYHGPDRWQHDMSRQRVLERAGWVFWRCFASTWTQRNDEVFADLLERLATMGIEPLGAIETASSLVEKRTWKPQPIAEA